MAKARIIYVVDDKELKALSKELKDIQGENKKVAEGFKDSNEEIKKGKTSLVDLKGAIAGLGLAGLAIAAVKEFAQLNAEITKSRKEVALLTKTTGLALDNITSKLRATSKVFDKDFNDLLRTANTVSKEFGISMTQALDEINQGFTRGLDVNGDYLDTLKEYSTFIKEAGLNTRQFNLLIEKQATQGIFSDKGIDAIKEAVLSIREMTPVTRDAIRGVGIDTKQMISDIKSGTTTYFEAVQQIATRTRELADPVKTGAILADVFKGAGEDAGDFIFTLDEVGNEYAELASDQQGYVDAQFALLQATEKTEKELLKLTSSTQGLGTALSTFWENIKSGTVGTLNDLINAFQSTETQMENFKQGVAGGDKESLQAAIGDLNAELEKAEKQLGFHESQTRKNIAVIDSWKEEVNKLNEQITIAETKVGELEQAEIDEAEAARLAELAASELSKTRAEQVIETEKARKASEELAKALAIEAEAQKKATAATRENLELKKLDPFEDKKSDFLKEVEAKAEQNEILKEQEKQLNSDLAEINKEHKDVILGQEEEFEEFKLELISEGFNTINEIAQSFTDLQIAQINQELQANELARNRELEQFAGNKEKEDAINKKFDAAQDKLREEQKQKEKTSAIISILINSAQAALKGIAQFGPPPSPLGIAALASVGIITALQLGAVAKLKDGVIDLQGPGTRTSDSIPAMLSKGESVITAAETSDYLPTLQAIRNREISPDILNNISMRRDTQPTIVVNDYDKLAKAVMRQPQKNVIVDENGFTGYIVSQSQVIKKKQSKYKM